PRAVSLQALEVGDPSQPHAEPEGVERGVAGHHARDCEKTRHQSVSQVQIFARKDVEGWLPCGARRRGDMDDLLHGCDEMQAKRMAIALEGRVLRLPVAVLVEEDGEAAEVVE